MFFSKIKLNKKGQSALFVAVSVSAFLLYVSLYTMNRSIDERKALLDAQNSVESFYLADIGIERFLYELKCQLDAPDDDCYGTYQSMEHLAKCINDNDCADNAADTWDNGEIVSVGNGSFRIVVSGNNIKAIGSYRNVNRAIELSYSEP